MVRKKDFSKEFYKKLSKLDKKEFLNVSKKIGQILNCDDINHYKNLEYGLSRYKRVHVNKHFVILFYEKKNIVYFDNYLHHDEAYRR